MGIKSLFIVIIYSFLFSSLVYSIEGRFKAINLNHLHAMACEQMLMPDKTIKMSRALERFIIPLGYMKIHLESNDSIKGTVDYLIDNDTRNHIFKIEALLRLYEKDKKIVGEIEALVVKVKGLEDAIGKYSEKLSYLKFAKKVNAESRVIKWIEGEIEVFYKLLEKELLDNWKTEGVKSSFGIEALFTDLQAVKWKSNKKDRKFLVNVLRKRFKKVDEQNYNMNLLQEGVHEYRRQIRWFPLYFQSLQGVINFSEGVGNSTIKELNALLEIPEVANNKYVLFDVSHKEKNPVIISFPYYLMLSKTVGKLGKYKDIGENFHYLTEAYVEAGVAATFDDAKATVHQIGEVAGEKEVDTAILADQIYQDIKDMDLLKSITKELMNQ